MIERKKTIIIIASKLVLKARLNGSQAIPSPPDFPRPSHVY